VKLRGGIVVALLLALVGCSDESSHVSPPFVRVEAVSAGGAGVHGIYGGKTVVDHKPNKYFGVAFPIRNRSDEPVTITRISSIDSGRPFLRPIGVKVVPFRPRSCPHRSCPPPHLSPEPPYREIGAMRPLTVQPQRSAAVVLHFRWVGCSAAPQRARGSANRVLRVEYRVDGRTGTQLVRTGSARLSIRSRGCA
jgi:hypothetical protein